MAFKALIFDSASMTSFLAGADLPAKWWEHFQIGDASSSIHSFQIDDLCYVLTSDSKVENPRLVIKIEDQKLFSGFNDETDRIEALHRCISVAQRLFEGKSNPIPLSWRPFSRGDVRTFQSNNRTSGETRRIAVRANLTGPKIVYAYDLTSRQAEFDTASPDDSCLLQANEKFEQALELSRNHFSSIQTAFEYIPLKQTLLQKIPLDAPLDEIIQSYLTDEQKRFIRLPLSPIRLSGVAGTGKTFAMIIKMLVETRDRANKSENFRFLFLTHNTTARDLVESYTEYLDPNGLSKSNNSGQSLQIDTLLNLAYKYLAAELTDVEPVSIDAHVGKSLQLDFISDIIENYRRGAWLSRRSKASEQMRIWVGAEKGSPVHRGFCWDVMNEIACALDAENVRDIPEKRSKYVSNSRSRSVMKLEIGADRQVLLDLYDEYRTALRTLGVISTDQLTLDFVGYLDSFRWEIKRQQEGFDAIFVDEFHLFNAVERGAFLPLLKKSDTPPALLMAYDVQQSPREAFLGLNTSTVDTGVRSFSVANAEKVQFTDIFRYTPEIAGALRQISHANPIDGIDSEWLSKDATSRLKSGPKPTAIEFSSTEDLYDFAFDAAYTSAKDGNFREVAVLSLSYPLFDQIKAAGKYRDRLFVIDSREDLMKLQYAGKRIIFSSPEYVSGFQFESVFVCDVNENDTETGSRTTWQNRRFSSLLYLAASRAKRDLYFLGESNHGGLASIIKTGIANGTIQKQSS